jgi:polyphosphate kinase 2 (PPK2 family)
LQFSDSGGIGRHGDGDQMKAADFIVAGRPRLAAIKHFPVVEFADYERRLATMQETLQLVQQAYLGTVHRAVIVMEGWDTAGKGGVVRRLGWALDPRSFKVHAIAAPSGREKSLHYLQRFWERLPQHGQIVVFDRSWYGRVLVERVEGFAAPTEWQRAYTEIKDFERMLLDDGTRLVKLFLHITPEEQMRRFRNRLTDPVKRWKLSYEDFRNRGRWKDYEAAIEDMMERTSTRHAPWHLLPANNKPFGRLAALRVIADRLSKRVTLEPRPLDPAVAAAAEKLLGIRLPAK